MKKLFSTTVLMMMVMLSISTVIAQKVKSKDDALKEIAGLTNTKKPEDYEKAYKLSKEFLARFGKDNDEKVVRVKKFHDEYRKDLFLKSIDAGKVAEASTLGKEILAEEPENTEVMINLAYAGYNARTAKGDKTFIEDSTVYSGKSIQLIEAGKLPATFSPFKDQTEALAWLNYIHGSLQLEKDLKVAVGYIYKAVTYETPLKNDSVPYYMIASYYEEQYARLSTDLKSKVAAKSISEAAVKTETDRVNQSIDLMLDAYARACKRAEAEKNPNLPQWKERLAQVYKFRKKTDAGLAEYINNIDATPMPDPSKF